MADIEITSDFSSVIETTKAVKNLDDTIAKAVASIIAENKRWERASKASADVQTQAIDRVIEAEEKLNSSQWFAAQRRKLDMMKASEALAKKNEEAVLKEATATLRQIEAVEKLNAAKAKSFQKSIGKNLGLGAVGISATESASVFQEEFNRQAEQAAQRLDYLKGKYDSAYQAERLYTVATRELTEAIQNQVGDVSVLQKRLDDLNEQYRLIGTSTNHTAEAFVKQQTVLQGNTQKLSRFGQATQQFGYQAGDFIVQVQSGTNAFVAFGQQATQLAGLLVSSLNPAVMAWGVALSIAIPLVTAIGATFMRTTEKAEDYKKPLEDALEITKKLREETDKIRFPDQTTKVVGDLKIRLQEAQKAVDDFNAKFEEMLKSGTMTSASLFTFSSRSGDLEKEKAAAEVRLEGIKEEIRLRDLLVQRENARQAEGAAQLAKLKAERDAQVKTQEQMNDKLTLGKNLFHAMAGETSSVSMYLNDALRAALGLANVDFSNIKNVAYFLSIYQGQMGRGRTAPGGPVFHYPLNADTRFGPSFEGSGRGGLPPALPNQPTLEGLFGDTGGGTGGAATENTIAQLQKQLNLEQELLGTSEAYQRVRQALGDDFAKTQPQVIDGLVAQIEAVEQLKKVEEDRKKIMDTVKSSLEDSFMSMVDGTKSVKDAFRDMARDIIKELYRVLVVQRLVNAISGFVSPAINSAIPMPSTAAPASVSMPKMSAPVSRSLPSANTTVVQNINISGTGDGAYVRSEISKALPQIVGATKSAVIDARRRGGQMAAAFS